MERNETPTSGVVAGYHVVYDNADEFYRLRLRARSLSTRRCPHALSLCCGRPRGGASWTLQKDALPRPPGATAGQHDGAHGGHPGRCALREEHRGKRPAWWGTPPRRSFAVCLPTSAQDALELFTAVGVVSQMADVAAWLCSLLRRDAVDDHTAACEASFRVLNPTLQTSGERAGQALNTRLRETMHARNISTACPTELIRPEDRALYATALTRAAGLRELAAGGA